MGLNPEKMEELKKKYNIGDDAIFEIADSLEPKSEVPEPLPLGRGKTTEAYPASLAAATQGSISMPEVIMYMDYQDRRDEKKERRYQSAQNPTNDIEKLINEMRDERRTHQEQIERIILGKRAEDAEERAKKSEEDLKKKEEEERQRHIVEGAVKGAVSEIDQKYGGKLDALANRLHEIPANQQKSFLDDLFTDIESGLKEEIKTTILNRLKEPEKPLTKTDESGKKSVDWEGLLDRGYKLADKYIDTMKGKPPKLPIQELPPGYAPLSEGSPKITGEPIPETTTPAATSPISPDDLIGIGPERAKTLAESGITDARQLSIVSPSHLKDILSISKEKAEDIIKQAKDLSEQS